MNNEQLKVKQALSGVRLTIIITLFVLCNAVCQAQVQQGYYTTADMGVPHLVTFKNGKMYIEAGGETSVFRNNGGKYVLLGYFYGGNESNMQTPKSRNPPFIVPQTNTSYKYCAYDQEKLYRLDAAQTQELQRLYNNDNLEERADSPKSEFVDVTLPHVEEIAPNYEKYMKMAKDDPDNAQVWLLVAQATIVVSTYTKMNNPLLDDMLLVKAKYIQRTAPHMRENPCPDVIPQEIWDKAKE